MNRALAAPLLVAGLLLTAACSENVSGDSNPDNFVEQSPAFDPPGEEQPSS